MGLKKDENIPPDFLAGAAFVKLAELNRGAELNSAQSRSALDSAANAPLDLVALVPLLAAANDLALLAVANVLVPASLVYLTCVMSVTSIS